ncbi:MAG: hypothetical protein NZ920_02260 [Aigarchaeota archaeon]|nr:hypothetical protein [Aigarchaeota archaeon]MDW8092551.1 hypothetical protein [Nitrososphaerota archaeon]
MRKTDAFIAVLLAIGLSILPINVEAQAGVRTVYVERQMTLEQGGLIYVIDRVEWGSGDSFTYGIASRTFGVLEHISADGGEIKYKGGTKDVEYFEVTPKRSTVTIKMVLRSMVAGFATNEYGIIIEPYPYIEGVNANVSAVLMRKGDMRYISPPAGWEETERGLETRNVLVNSTDQLTPTIFPFTSTTFTVLEIERIEYVYNVGSETLSVNLRIKNNSPRTITDLRLFLPRGVDVTSVFDSVGDVAFRREGDALIILLSQSRFSLERGWKISFTVTLKRSGGVETFGSTGDGAFIRPFSVLNSSVGSILYTFVLPPSSRLLDYSKVYEVYNSPAGETVVSYLGSPKEIYDAGVISVGFSRGGSQQLASLLLFAGIAILAVGGAVVTRSRKRAAKPRVKREQINVILEELTKVNSVAMEILRLTESRRASKEVNVQLHSGLTAIRRGKAKVSEVVTQMKREQPHIPSRVDQTIALVDTIYESCRALVKNYEDLHKGSIGRSSFERIATSLKKDLRRDTSNLANLIEQLRSTETY